MNELEIRDLDARELHRHRGALRPLLDGQQLGFIVRGVFDRELLANVVAQLDSGRAGLSPTRVEHYGGRQFGRTLVISDPDLREYFAEAHRFRAACADLFAPVGFEPRIREVIEQLGDGRNVVAPKGPDGTEYGPSTIRVIGDGGAIHLHCENETLRFPGMIDLGPRIDPQRQLSFYVPLALPESGGELHVYGARFDNAGGQALARRERDSDDTIRFVEQFGSVVARPGIGDLLVFDAGRHYHRVTRVTGPRERWTMGGFIAEARDRDDWYYWA